MDTQVWLSLGSNLGDRKGQLQFAVAELAAHPQIRLGRKSGIYQTAPWGNVQEQDDFYNAVAEIFTTLTPWELLKELQKIEAAAGRRRIVHWGARELDIDILLFGEAHIATGELQVPHPYIQDRLFVLQPLSEIAGDMDIPDKGNLQLIINNLQGQQRVEKICDAEDW
ncbi:MAG: 2-amino-4-hydroxy-6-hydroxymethyldihydropteridine diphosphokinase [Firmicutes bacterium]|nr:2-amino-4-hydroxy-6-hydroxymethyldihydropteridine diphosphokinase [Bacillota bacterium]